MSPGPALPSVAVFRVSTWDDVVRLGHHFSHHIFRGVQCADWTFRPSLERTAERFEVPSHCLPNAEKALILERFQRAAHLYFPPAVLPAPEDWLGWMSLVQHYGGPSRLLDFTESFYCAAFFALQNAKSRAAIWAIDDWQLRNQARAKLLRGEGRRTLAETAAMLRQKLNSTVGVGGGPRVVIPFRPDKLHERLAHQQGLFLAPCLVDVPFQIQLLDTLDISPDALAGAEGEPRCTVAEHPNLAEIQHTHLVKIEMEPALFQIGRGELRRMNLTSSTLFPGPDGYAASFHWELGGFQPVADFEPEGAGTVADLAERWGSRGEENQ